jgi:gas vesicle protein
MVQSLPTLGQPWEHSAIDQAASYYSNRLAQTLLGQSPQVKNIFEQWKRETGAETSFTSQLKKDEELPLPPPLVPP